MLLNLVSSREQLYYILLELFNSRINKTHPINYTEEANNAKQNSLEKLTFPVG